MRSIQDIQQLVGNAWTEYEQAFHTAVVAQDNELLRQIWEYVHSKCGKQIRPTLVLLSAALCRGITEKTIDTAVAMELMHTASLIHDDVVDHSPTRRGQSAVQAVWTNKIAVLTGDYLLARVIAQTAKVRNQRILQIVAHIGEELSDGELLQLHAGSSMWITREQYYRVIEKKTAVLFAACTEAGAESSGATERQRHALRRFGMELGICFQIVDDILDYSGGEHAGGDQLGKERMQDWRDGKVTLPLLIAAERAGTHPETDDIEQIRDFVMRYDGISGARKEMEMHKKSALEALKLWNRGGLIRDGLEDLVELCCNRIA